MFKKKVNPSTIPTAQISLINIDNYTPDGNDKLKIGMVNDLILFNFCRMKKSDIVIRALITTVRISDDFAEAYGNSLIVVGKKFLKLPNKQQLALIEIENALEFDLLNTTNKVMSAPTILDEKIDAELTGIKKFGKHAVKALEKNHKMITKGEKQAGLYLYKAEKKSAKLPSTVLTKPIIQEVDEPAMPSINAVPAEA